MSQESKMRGEAEALCPFLIGIQSYISIEDVSYVTPDPPDFRLKAMGKTVGLELTRSNPKRFGKRGNAKLSEFKKWELEKRANPKPRHEFEWGTFTLGDSIAAFKNEVERKTERAKFYSAGFDETWLVFQAEKGSPHSGLAEGTYGAYPGQEERVLDFFGKHLFEVVKICMNARPFKYILLFCGTKFLAIPVSDSAFAFPKPDEALLQRGKKVSDEYLSWSRTLRSVTRHYDRSQGDLGAWLKEAPK